MNRQFPIDCSPVLSSHQEGSQVCILGCGRSGTSIFGELFQSLPNFRYYSEPNLKSLPQIDFSSPVAIKVPRPEPDSQTSPGLPFLLSEFLHIFPDTGTIFWQVRHPLDTICSLQIGIKNQWGHHPRPHDYQSWLKRPLIEQCAYHWNYLNTIGFRQIKHLAKINRFESMIQDPLQNALICMNQAGINGKECLPEIRRWASRVQNKNNHKFIEAECSKPYSRNDHTNKVDRWRENLTKKQIAQVLPLIKEGAEEFGYDLSIKLPPDQ